MVLTSNNLAVMREENVFEMFRFHTQCSATRTLGKGSSESEMQAVYDAWAMPSFHLCKHYEAAFSLDEQQLAKREGGAVCRTCAVARVSTTMRPGAHKREPGSIFANQSRTCGGAVRACIDAKCCTPLGRHGVLGRRSAETQRTHRRLKKAMHKGGNAPARRCRSSLDACASVASRKNQYIGCSLSLTPPLCLLLASTRT